MANSYRLSYNYVERFWGFVVGYGDPTSFDHADWSDQGNATRRIENPTFGFLNPRPHDVKVTPPNLGTRANFNGNTFNGNDISSNGAAILYAWNNKNTNPRLFVQYTDFENNNCSNGSGIVYVNNATQVEFDSCTFKTNKVFSGGALTVSETTGVSITSCVFNGNGKLNTPDYDRGAIYCNSTSLTITNCQFQTVTDDIYLNNTNAALHGTNNSSVADIVVAGSGSITIKQNSALKFAGSTITAPVNGEAGSTIEFINKDTHSREVNVNGNFNGVRNLVFSGDKPIRFTVGEGATNVQDAQSLTISAGKLGSTTGWPYTVATGIVFEPSNSTTNGRFKDLSIVVDGETITATAPDYRSALFEVKESDTDVQPDYTYMFTHDGTCYGLLHHDGKLVLAVIPKTSEDYYVNSWYENIYDGGTNTLCASIISGESAIPDNSLLKNENLIGVYEFAYLTKDGGTGTFTNGRPKSINDKYENLVGTNVYITGGTFSGDQYGYGANLVVCNDQRNGFEMVMGEGNTVSAVHSNPMRKDDLVTVGGTASNGKSTISNGFLFGGDNSTVSSAGQALGTASRSVNIYAGLAGKGVFAGDRITVNATGGSMILKDAKLEVKASTAGYAASTVETRPDCQVSYLMGGSYISGGSTEEQYTMTLNHVNAAGQAPDPEDPSTSSIVTSNVTIGNSAGYINVQNPGLSVSLYACAGSLVGGGYDGKQLEVTLKGHPSLSISSGTYEYLVAGGNLLQGDKSKLHHIGDTSLTIDGGTFKGNIYGGNISRFLKDATSERLKMTGNTNILIKVDGAQEVNITGHTDKEPGRYGNIFGGSNGRGTINGSTNITFQGDGILDNSNKLTFTGAISGDSSGAGYFHKDGVFGHYGFVTGGSRNLTFQDFDGDFNTSQIVNIDTITFTGKTDMAFTNAELNLTDIGTWNFDFCDTSLTTLDCSAVTNALNVADDKLVVTGVLDNFASGSEWTLINAKGFNSTGDLFSTVELFGNTAMKSGDTWTAASNLTLTLDRTAGTLVLARG